MDGCAHPSTRPSAGPEALPFQERFRNWAVAGTPFLLLALVASAAIAFAVVQFLSSQHTLDRLRAELRQAHVELSAAQQQRLEKTRVLEKLADDLSAARRKAARSELERSRLEARLALAEEQIRQLTRQRDTVRRLMGLVQEGRDASRRSLSELRRENDTLRARLASMESRLSRAIEERDMARRVEKGLRWRVDLLETRVSQLNSLRDNTTAWLGEWVAGHVSAIEQMLADAGVDPDELLKRAAGDGAAGTGGPLELLEVEPAAGGSEPQVASLDRNVVRLQAAQQLITAMPLTAPLDYYYLTSRFGPRRDPITGKRAMHRGVDFGAPAGSRVRAPAPGRVVRAGPGGAYGRMVEIDHGFGIVTRYGHLRKILVKKGDRVDLRQPIGIVGNSGRSTGRHLHYEIRIDGKAVDPERFLEAGRNLAAIFKG